MRLTEAEAQLSQGNWQSAMAIINALRSTIISDHTGEAMAAWDAGSAEEAWTHLKRERGIELFLEGRRLGNLRRWIEGNVPGETEDMTNRIRLCFPIVQGERQTNPNVPLDHPDPQNPIFTGLP